MTAVLVALVVCGAGLAALVLFLRFLSAVLASRSVAVAKSTEDELREAFKQADIRISRLEMKAALR